jgi:hypothetical protein
MKTTSLLLSGLFILCTTTLQAATTGQVTGKIFEEETKNVLSYTEIVFENSMDKIVLKSNENGIYYGDHLPTGKYNVTVGYNGRSFVMKNVRVYDGYATEIDFSVSINNALPEVVFVEQQAKLTSSISPTDVMLGHNNTNQPTRSVTEALSQQPGMDVREGKLYVKGSSEVRFFIDGTPLMGQPTFQRYW